MNKARFNFSTLFFLILLIFFLIHCSQTNNDSLITTIDSIARLPMEKRFDSLYAEKVDSTYNHIEYINILINEKNIDSLIQHFNIEGRIDGEHFNFLAPEWAKKMNFKRDTILFPSVFTISESKKQFAVTFDESLAWNKKYYIISKDKVLAILNVSNKYGTEFNSFINQDGESIFYYSYQFSSGTGIWWYQYFFYKIDDNGIKPVLNQIAHSNLAFPWSNRSYQINSTVMGTQPLEIKYRYWQSIIDTTNQNSEQLIVNDSTVLCFRWDKNKQCYEADYKNAKLNHLQFSCFQLISEGNLFIKAFNRQLKDSLQVTKKRNAIEAFVKLSKRNKN